MWHKPCRTFHPWCLCIKTRCLLDCVVTNCMTCVMGNPNSCMLCNVNYGPDGANGCGELPWLPTSICVTITVTSQKAIRRTKLGWQSWYIHIYMYVSIYIYIYIYIPTHCRCHWWAYISALSPQIARFTWSTWGRQPHVGPMNLAIWAIFVGENNMHHPVVQFWI